MTQTTYMTAVEVAKALGVSRTTVKRKAANGKLPVAAKVPGGTGAYLFDRATIEALASERGAA